MWHRIRAVFINYSCRRSAVVFCCFQIVFYLTHEHGRQHQFNAFSFFIFFHTDLVHCTNEPNVSIPHLANLLVERTQNANWVVVYKSLLTVHHLLAYGNEVGLSCSSSSQLDDSDLFSFYLVLFLFFPMASSDLCNI